MDASHWKITPAPMFGTPHIHRRARPVIVFNRCFRILNSKLKIFVFTPISKIKNKSYVQRSARRNKRTTTRKIIERIIKHNANNLYHCFRNNECDCTFSGAFFHCAYFARKPKAAQPRLRTIRNEICNRLLCWCDGKTKLDVNQMQNYRILSYSMTIWYFAYSHVFSFSIFIACFVVVDIDLAIRLIWPTAPPYLV